MLYRGSWVVAYIITMDQLALSQPLVATEVSTGWRCPRYIFIIVGFYALPGRRRVRVSGRLAECIIPARSIVKRVTILRSVTVGKIISFFGWGPRYILVIVGFYALPRRGGGGGGGGGAACTALPGTACSWNVFLIL